MFVETVLVCALAAPLLSEVVSAPYSHTKRKCGNGVLLKGASTAYETTITQTSFKVHTDSNVCVNLSRVYQMSQLVIAVSLGIISLSMCWYV